METAQVTEVPAQSVDVVEPLINDKRTENPSEVVAIEADNNHVSNEPVETIKVHEPEMISYDPTEGNRPIDNPATASTDNSGDTVPIAVSGRHASPRTSCASEGGSEVVTPAGTVEAPPISSDALSTEVVWKEAVLRKDSISPITTGRETRPASLVVQIDPLNSEQCVEHKAETAFEQKIESTVEQKTEEINDDKVKPAVEYKCESVVEHKHEVVTPIVSAPAASEVTLVTATAITEAIPTADPTPTEAPALSPGKKTKKPVSLVSLDCCVFSINTFCVRTSPLSVMTS
ncbi:unnamed protein product [Phytophthora fragariaefolia]|uniref:Unnamed protein product n=1 Tax=Phytophthora fragariaefolia TaxID=1490495 RepID=A0A9W6X065_9STRA|nr:unnamed protein product [Phytophthora fragariaefolia]